MESLREFRRLFPLLPHKLIDGPICIGSIAVPRCQTSLDEFGRSCAFQPDGSHTAIERQLQEFLSIRFSLECGIDDDSAASQQSTASTCPAFVAS